MRLGGQVHASQQNMYKDKISKEVSIEVGILSKEKVNFYGV